MDFGTIKNTFTQTYIDSHIKGGTKGKELYKSFLKMLKESETLKSAFIVYKNLESKTTSTEFEANEYLNGNLSILSKFRGNKSIVTESKKLTNLLENNDITMCETTELYKSLHILITTPKNIHNLNKIHEAKLKVIKWLMEDKTETVEDKTNVRENLDVQKFLNIATEKFNVKYSGLSEEEKNIIKVLRNGTDEDRSSLLHSMVTETVSLINNKLKDTENDLTLKSKLLETKDVIYNMFEYNIETFNENITKLYNIKTVLND